MSGFLITSDLHLTDRPKDAYRFGIFKWLVSQQAKWKPKATFILGDLTDKKDKHPAALVRQIVDGLLDLAPPVFILKGNHDYLDPECPFFDFLNYIEGLRFITQPESPTEGVFMLPHCGGQQEFDAACRLIPSRSGVMLHQTIDGAVAEYGTRLSGLSASLVSAVQPRWVWAGDVHKPQQLGTVSYVGAPYTVRFGDDYDPRVIYVSRTDQSRDLYFDCPRKWVLKVGGPEDITANEDLRAGDQVKIEVVLTREELCEWQTCRRQVLQACERAGLEVFGVTLTAPSPASTPSKAVDIGVTPEEMLIAFCKREKVPATVKKAGFTLLGTT